ncbi:hypothetical protein PR048_030718 [Dryococelus australis]|uniref:Uncharacterized protein n=1 Tax=Dryococelus australis TaxID=614101 RepID=A0ABQ9G9Q5_9NEOP|nr:hypothetical protein PR048_030718 [Dryococelus australis]
MDFSLVGILPDDAAGRLVFSSVLQGKLGLAHVCTFSEHTAGSIVTALLSRELNASRPLASEQQGTPTLHTSCGEVLQGNLDLAHVCTFSEHTAGSIVTALLSRELNASRPLASEQQGTPTLHTSCGEVLQGNLDLAHVCTFSEHTAGSIVTALLSRELNASRPLASEQQGTPTLHTSCGEVLQGELDLAHFCTFSEHTAGSIVTTLLSRELNAFRPLASEQQGTPTLHTSCGEVLQGELDLAHFCTFSEHTAGSIVTTLLSRELNASRPLASEQQGTPTLHTEPKDTRRCSGLTARLPPRRAGFDSRPGQPRILAHGNRAGRCRWSAGIISGISRFPRPCVPALLHSNLISPSSALKTPEVLEVDESELRCEWSSAGMQRREKSNIPEKNPTDKHDSHLRRSGRDPAGDRTRFALFWNANSLTAELPRPLPSLRTHSFTSLGPFFPFRRGNAAMGITHRPDDGDPIARCAAEVQDFVWVWTGIGEGVGGEGGRESLRKCTRCADRYKTHSNVLGISQSRTFFFSFFIGGFRRTMCSHEPVPASLQVQTHMHTRTPWTSGGQRISCPVATASSPIRDLMILVPNQEDPV